MTTEHFALQGTRGTTVSESSSRVSSFLVTVSSTLVALAFVGQISRLSTVFYVFGLVLFPSVFFIGLFTFERVLQSGIEDLRCDREIHRIRHFYLELAPELAPYFLMSTHDDAAGMMHDMGAAMSGRWGYIQGYLTTAGMVAVIDSIIAGAFAGLLVGLLANPPLVIPAIIGVLAFLASVFAFQKYQEARWLAADRSMTPLFPSPDGDSIKI
jgi:hypothetical protein